MLRGRFSNLVFLALFAVVIVLGFGCGDEPPVPLGSKLSVPPRFTYPLEIGNRWSYNGVFTMINCEPDTACSLEHYSAHFTSVVEIESVDTFMDTLETYKFHETLTEHRYDTVPNGETVYHTYNYFRNASDGFYWHASSGPNTRVSPVKLHPDVLFLFRGQRYSTIQEIFQKIERTPRLAGVAADTPNYNDPPPLCLRYPLAVGSQWSFREDCDPWCMDKKILSWKSISVFMQEFDCYDIRWLWDMDDDGQWDDDIERHDYLAEIGLVTRATIFRDIVATTVTGDTLGIFDVWEAFYLTDYHLE
ncbi:MAG: hypothetical protein JSU69_02465 [Candidatus Zixiibacteriota bacterium]|nr:MAG: hypothetical protein JSU69_02465 [candidate division Zixibacteria bacterium]